MSNTVDKVINYALSQVGYLEKSKEAYLADPSVLYKFTDGAGSDNYTKYGKEMHDIYPSVMDFPASWCDAFADACFMNCYGVANAKGLLGGDFNDYTVSSAQLYKNKGAYFKSPKVGDQIFFNNGKRICHTGLVYKVDEYKVYTVEGNTSGGNSLVANGGGVAKKSYPLTYERIDGYGRPKYDEDVADGWVKNGEKWYYYRNGQPIKKEWLVYQNRKYRLGNNGEMLTEWHQILDENNIARWYYFDSKGILWHETSKNDGSMEEWVVE